MIKQQNNLDNNKSSSPTNQNMKDDTENGEIKLSGFVTAWIIEDGVETLAHKKSNLVVSNGKKILAGLLSGKGADRKISTLKLGTGVGAPSFTETNLNQSEYFQPIDQGTVEVKADNTITYTITVATTAANSDTGPVAYTEAGLFSGGIEPLMYARETFPAMNKDAGRGLKFQWVLSF